MSRVECADGMARIATGKLAVEAHHSNGDVHGTWRPGRKCADGGESCLDRPILLSDLPEH